MRLLSEKWEIGLLSNDGGAMPEIGIDRQMTAATNRRSWFAAYTISRHEKRIAEQCDRIGILSTFCHFILCTRPGKIEFASMFVCRFFH